MCPLPAGSGGNALRKPLVVLGVTLAISIGSVLAIEPEAPGAQSRSSGSRTLGHVLYWTGAAFDTYTTVRALDTPGLREENPVMAPFIKRLGTAGGVLLVKAGLYTLFYRMSRGEGRLSVAVLPIAGGAQILVGLHNLQVIRSVRNR